MKKLILVLMILAILGMAFGARMALVIGNSRYPDKPLKNPVNDAELMRQTLDKLNFTVVKLTDLNRQAFDNAIRDFAAKLEANDEVVFYYSGHGSQVNGENFLLPVGEKIEDESDVQDKAIRLDWVTSKLSSTKITMVFLDACRDNPYAKYRSNAKGLAMSSTTGNNMFMMYSTEAGSVANDGKGANSDFTSSLCTEMLKPGLSLDEITTNVTADVREATNDSQRPWKGGSLSYTYYFNQPQNGLSERFTGYQGHPYGRISSTVEERLSKANKTPEFYNPTLSKYVTINSATEFLIEDLDNNDYTLCQMVSRNTLGMKVPFFGVEAFFNTAKNWKNTNNNSGALVKQMGAGAGLPNPESIRLFGYLVENDLSAYAPYETYLGFKGEAAKRIRSTKQFTELGCEFEYNQVPDTFKFTGIPAVDEYFEQSALDWTPNLRFNAYLLASSLKNRYLEANNFRGLAPANSPLLIANQTANALIAKVSVEKHDTKLVNDRTVTADFMLPLNFGKIIGTDFGYRWQQYSDWKTNTQTSSRDLNAALRLTFVPMEYFRVIGSAEYDRASASQTEEDLYFGGYGVLKLGYHIAALASFKYKCIWNRAQGFTDFDPEGFIFGSTIAIRL